jgi:ACT domain-containing protein
MKQDCSILLQNFKTSPKPCKIMGVSRDTFYRYQELVEADGLEGLINRGRRVPNLKNRVGEGTEQAVIGHAVDFPA